MVPGTKAHSVNLSGKDKLEEILPYRFWLGQFGVEFIIVQPEYVLSREHICLHNGHEASNCVVNKRVEGFSRPSR